MTARTFRKTEIDHLMAESALLSIVTVNANRLLFGAGISKLPHVSHYLQRDTFPVPRK